MNNENEPSLGKQIYLTFHNASKIGVQLEALREEISNRFAEAAVKFDHTQKYSINNDEKESEYYRFDDSGWLYTDAAYSLPLKPKGRGKKNNVYFCYQISLYGDGVRNDEPLVHIMLWKVPIDFNDDNYMGYPLDKTVEPELIDSHLICWPTDKSSNTPKLWTFSVKLASINSTENIEEKLVKPAIALINAGDVKELKEIAENQLAKTDGIVQYTEDGFKSLLE